MADVLEYHLSSQKARLVEESQAGVIARCGHRFDFCSILPSTFIKVRMKGELKPEIPNIVMIVA